MKKQLKLAAGLICVSAATHAQQTVTDPQKTIHEDNAAFVFSESQLGEDDDVTQSISVVSSNNNVFTSNVGYTFSPMRFKYRAYDSRYNDIYFNGVLANNGENGRFSYSTIGGMNDATRSMESSLPFESNAFSFAGLGGSNNYDFRASHYAAGGKATLSGANRNYRLRGMFTYATGLKDNGWAFMGTVGYRWANEGWVEGTYYNSLAYFLSAQKVFNSRHSLSFATWGNPTERSTQGASTDEAYWLANDRYYNPYWGYQDGKKRNSRVVNNYEPSALITWDFNINENAKLTTTVLGRYAMYSSTKLNYNGAENPAPDYWKNFPSAIYNVWDGSDVGNTEYSLQSWVNSRDYWMASKANRQIQWDKLYYANRQQNLTGQDAAYYIQAKHNDHLTVNLASTLDLAVTKDSKWQVGVNLGTNKGMHYQTMEDMLGADNMHNINNYAIGTYTAHDPEVQYDLNNPNGRVGKGDRFGYDYNLFVNKMTLWTQYALNKGIAHSYIAGKVGASHMWRDGNMRNGLAADNSYGKSQKARFLDGGVKIGTNLNLGYGNTLTFGFGMEARSPQAYVAFQAPEINNNFAENLRCEHVNSVELGYALNTSWLRANLTGYFTHTSKGNEWQNFYYDDVNSFTYVSLNGVTKNYYGVELGMQFKVTSNFKINVLGVYSDAQYTENTAVSYMHSTSGTLYHDVCMNKNMRESGTPLTVGSIGLSYNIKGWYLDLTGNYYDRIYLSYAPNLRYTETLKNMGNVDNEGNYNVPEQLKGKGGFMLDASIGKQFRIGKNRLSVNLMATNVTNNQKMVSGGYEQSRSNYSASDKGDGNYETGSKRIYDFQKNPKKYYVQGINGMLNINYRF
ncbi:MAG: outer membrane beta-barrel family protein [Paraprevotella sp.]|nr:outer membrane beta-barrel family protein [Paraprevotella sp.]